jgi:hypothetical protein
MITYSLYNIYNSGSMIKRNRSESKKSALGRLRRANIASERQITVRMECP